MKGGQEMRKIEIDDVIRSFADRYSTLVQTECTDVKDKFHKYGYELRELKNYNEIINQKQRNIPYLYYENQNGEMFLADAPVVESQFIRKLIAKDINALDRALWNENIRKADIVKTLRPYFDKMKGNSIWE